MAGTWSPPKQLAVGVKENGRSTENQVTGEVVEIGDFRIDTGRHTASLRGEPLGLTGEEFDVLVFLTTNPQGFVTPQTTLAMNWLEGRLHQTDFLRVLLSLRKKLETAAPGQQYLRTEPWVIYRFHPTPSTAR
jgi:two-component system, OmpR family, KDP operon response regulator KdpE